MRVALDEWAWSVLADPITKEPFSSQKSHSNGGVIDARVLLQNTAGYEDWAEGQKAFESLEETSHYGKKPLSHFKQEIENDSKIYEFFSLQEPILDVGGSVGLLREFLPESAEYIVVDPFVNVMDRLSENRKLAYSCLSRPLNFVGGVAEFLPIKSGSMQTVHMRSMLDHVQVVDLCLLEAKRVLRSDGLLLIGITIEGRPYGKEGIDLRPSVLLKNTVKKILATVGFVRFKDEHVWHPTFKNLTKVIKDAGFVIENVYWQPAWEGKVVYVGARIDPKQLSFQEIYQAR